VLPQVSCCGRKIGIDAPGNDERAAHCVTGVGEGYRCAVDPGAGGVDVVDEVDRRRVAVFSAMTKPSRAGWLCPRSAWPRRSSVRTGTSKPRPTMIVWSGGGAGLLVEGTTTTQSTGARAVTRSPWV
jgi:hypothetical protein